MHYLEASQVQLLAFAFDKGIINKDEFKKEAGFAMEEPTILENPEWHLEQSKYTVLEAEQIIARKQQTASLAEE